MKKDISTIVLYSCIVTISSLFVFYGCNFFGKSCEELSVELKEAYNSYVDEVSVMPEAELVQKCQKAIDKCPDISIAYELLGMISWDNDRMAEGLSYYIKAVEIAPNNEYTVTDAKIIAFESGKQYLSVNENGGVELEPYSGITLEKYASSPEEVRMQWCQYSLDLRQDPSKTQKIVDQNGKELGTRTVSVYYDISTPKELDDGLLLEAENNSQAILSKTTADLAIKGSMSMDANIDPNALIQ